MRELLLAEFARRRAVNPRYSLRAFAAYLQVDHSTLSQILRGRRVAPAGALRDWGARLGIGPEEVEVRAAAGAEDAAALAALNARAHWLGEARALVTGAAHWRLLELMRSPDWRPDTRWIAARIGTRIDDVNDALARLLRLGFLAIGSDGVWRDISGIPEPDADNVKERALARLRATGSAA
jgi:transcriptional regulator with XRE-family HTH domain